jgi:hypothetical protein
MQEARHLRGDIGRTTKPLFPGCQSVVRDDCTKQHCKDFRQACHCGLVAARPKKRGSGKPFKHMKAVLLIPCGRCTETRQRRCRAAVPRCNRHPTTVKSFPLGEPLYKPVQAASPPRARNRGSASVSISLHGHFSSFQPPDSDADSDPDQAVERPVQRFLRGDSPPREMERDLRARWVAEMRVLPNARMPWGTTSGSET